MHFFLRVFMHFVLSLMNVLQVSAILYSMKPTSREGGETPNNIDSGRSSTPLSGNQLVFGFHLNGTNSS